MSAGTKVSLGKCSIQDVFTNDDQAFKCAGFEESPQEGFIPVKDGESRYVEADLDRNGKIDQLEARYLFWSSRATKTDQTKYISKKANNEIIESLLAEVKRRKQSVAILNNVKNRNFEAARKVAPSLSGVFDAISKRDFPKAIYEALSPDENDRRNGLLAIAASGSPEDSLMVMLAMVNDLNALLVFNELKQENYDEALAMALTITEAPEILLIFDSLKNGRYYAAAGIALKINDPRNRDSILAVIRDAALNAGNTKEAEKIELLIKNDPATVAVFTKQIEKYYEKAMSDAQKFLNFNGTLFKSANRNLAYRVVLSSAAKPEDVPEMVRNFFSIKDLGRGDQPLIVDAVADSISSGDFLRMSLLIPKVKDQNLKTSFNKIAGFMNVQDYSSALKEIDSLSEEKLRERLKNNVFALRQSNTVGSVAAMPVVAPVHRSAAEEVKLVADEMVRVFAKNRLAPRTEFKVFVSDEDLREKIELIVKFIKRFNYVRALKSLSEIKNQEIANMLREAVIEIARKTKIGNYKDVIKMPESVRVAVEAGNYKAAFAGLTKCEHQEIVEFLPSLISGSLKSPEYRTLFAKAIEIKEPKIRAHKLREIISVDFDMLEQESVIGELLASDENAKADIVNVFAALFAAKYYTLADLESKTDPALREVAEKQLVGIAIKGFGANSRIEFAKRLLKDIPGDLAASFQLDERISEILWQDVVKIIQPGNEPKSNTVCSPALSPEGVAFQEGCLPVDGAMITVSGSQIAKINLSSKEIIRKADATNITFVLDYSGSMKTKVGEFKRQVEKAIDKLPERIRYNLNLFGPGNSDLKSNWEKSPIVELLDASKEEVKQQLSSTSPAGATLLWANLEASVIATKDGGAVMLYSDGRSDISPGKAGAEEPDKKQRIKSIIDYVKQHNIKIFVFCGTTEAETDIKEFAGMLPDRIFLKKTYDISELGDVIEGVARNVVFDFREPYLKVVVEPAKGSRSVFEFGRQNADTAKSGTLVKAAGKMELDSATGALLSIKDIAYSDENGTVVPVDLSRDAIGNNAELVYKDVSKEVRPLEITKPLLGQFVSFVLDRSGSMSGMVSPQNSQVCMPAAKAMKDSPIERLKQASKEVCHSLIDKGSAVSINLFSSEEMNIELPETTKAEDSDRVIENMRADGGTEGWENLLASIYNAPEDSNVVVFSDGEFNTNEKYSDALFLAKKKRVRVSFVGLGDFNKSATAIPMRFLTDLTGGKYLPVDDAKRLPEAFEQMKKEIQHQAGIKIPFTPTAIRIPIISNGKRRVLELEWPGRQSNN